jgi:hypothetical protein
MIIIGVTAALKNLQCSALTLSLGLALGVFVLLTAGCREGTSEGKKQELLLKRAQLEIDSFIGACEGYRQDNGVLPSGVHGLYGKENYLIRQILEDPWGTQYKYTLQTNVVAVKSAGPDRQWDTSDDLRRQLHYAHQSARPNGS